MPLSPFQVSEERWYLSFSDQFSVSGTQRHGVKKIPGEYSAKYLRCLFQAEDAGNYWFAGWLNQFYDNASIEDQFIKGFKIPINKPSIVEADDFVSPYHLNFNPTERFFNFTLRIWYLT